VAFRSTTDRNHLIKIANRFQFQPKFSKNKSSFYLRDTAEARRLETSTPITAISRRGLYAKPLGSFGQVFYLYVTSEKLSSESLRFLSIAANTSGLSSSNNKWYTSQQAGMINGNNAMFLSNSIHITCLSLSTNHSIFYTWSVFRFSW